MKKEKVNMNIEQLSNFEKTHEKTFSREIHYCNNTSTNTDRIGIQFSLKWNLLQILLQILRIFFSQ